ncbi:MAG: peptidoglycan DD-metalloendopeptidase family protein [Acidimicrobiales bacterium]
MIRIVTTGTVLLAAPLAALFGLTVIVAGAGSGSGAAAGHAAFNPSEEAVADIPAPLITLYIEAAAICPGLPWQVLAGVGKVESNHGRYGGATVRADGRVEPPIIGIPLNGTNGTARIPDTDDGTYDGDTVWDRAVGPMQFIPSSWANFGVDGNGDGVRDPHNIADAVHAAVRHLCPAGTVTDIEAALFSYNRSTAYVATVLDWAARYTGALAAIGAVTEGYAYPLPPAFATDAIATRRHHDYPAFDAGTPVGTPVFAMVGGTITTAIGNAGVYQPGGPGRCGNTVILSGSDGATYTYCHFAAVTVIAGQTVVAGQGLGLTGGQPGTPGAGNTTGPHLHLGIRSYGNVVCPQPLLLAILRDTPIPPAAAPTTGCYYPGPSTDWAAWLDALPATAPTTD